MKEFSRTARKPGPIRRVLRWTVALIALAMIAYVAVYYEADPGDDAPRILVSVDRTLWNRVGLNRMTYVRALRRPASGPY